MNTLQEIIYFLENQTGCEKIKADTDIFADLGVVGDDFHEMIDLYARKYNVDMTKYLWYFHSDEEGQSIGGGFSKPPYERVKRIPVTPNMLTEFSNKGAWTIDYPEHTLPKRRYDLIINQIIVLCIVTIIVVTLVSKCKG